MASGEDSPLAMNSWGFNCRQISRILAYYISAACSLWLSLPMKGALSAKTLINRESNRSAILIKMVCNGAENKTLWYSLKDHLAVCQFHWEHVLSDQHNKNSRYLLFHNVYWGLVTAGPNHSIVCYSVDLNSSGTPLPFDYLYAVFVKYWMHLDIKTSDSKVLITIGSLFKLFFGKLQPLHRLWYTLRCWKW